MTVAVRRLLPAVVATALLAAALSGCSLATTLEDLVPRAETRDAGGEITKGGTTDVFTLREGDCLDDASFDADADGADAESEDATADQAVSDVETIPCDEPHDFEAYKNVPLTGGDEFPGSDSVFDEAEALCAEAFDEFVGSAYEDSIYDYVDYTPTADSWSTGDRVANCLIGDPAGKTVGSLAGIGR